MIRTIKILRTVINRKRSPGPGRRGATGQQINGVGRVCVCVCVCGVMLTNCCVIGRVRFKRVYAHYFNLGSQMYHLIAGQNDEPRRPGQRGFVR